MQKLQDDRTVRKICKINDHVCLALTSNKSSSTAPGSSAKPPAAGGKPGDGRVHNPLRGSGRRPFGLSALIVWFDYDDYDVSDGSLRNHALRANATGRSSKTVSGFLEQNYSVEEVEDDEEAGG